MYKSHPPIPEPPALALPLQRTFRLVTGLGVWKSTLLFTALVCLVSLSLTWAILRLTGHDSMGSGFYISLLVPAPMTLITSPIIFALIIALEKARHEAHELSMTDTLTGLSNRRHFLRGVQREFSLAQRHRLGMAVMILDIDHFKNINDRFGHHQGDEVLKAVSRSLAHEMRATDLLARWGGEEFVALLPNTACEPAFQMAERLRHAVEIMPRTGPNADQIATTVSVGVACAKPGEALSLDSLLQMADSALYDAKRAGRNQVAPPPPSIAQANKDTGSSRFSPLVAAS